MKLKYKYKSAATVRISAEGGNSVGALMKKKLNG